MKKILTIIALSILMVGCGYEYVPQGTKGKILDREGFHPEVYPPSRVSVGRYGHLVLVETVTQTINEPITIRMKDNMDLVASVRFQLRMGNKDSSLNAVFNDILPTNNRISLNQVYQVYGKVIVNKVAREVLSSYRIGDVQANFAKISSDIYSQVKSEFKPTPLIITDVALGKLKYPKVIDDAILAAAKRNLEIAQAEADVAVKLTELAGKEKVASGEYRIKMQDAKRIRDYNKMIAQGITSQLLKLRELEVQEAMVKAIKDGSAAPVFIPYGSQRTVGMQQRMYSK